MSQDPALDGHILNIVQTEQIEEQIDLQNALKTRLHDSSSNSITPT